MGGWEHGSVGYNCGNTSSMEAISWATPWRKNSKSKQYGQAGKEFARKKCILQSKMPGIPVENKKRHSNWLLLQPLILHIEHLLILCWLSKFAGGSYPAEAGEAQATQAASEVCRVEGWVLNILFDLCRVRPRRSEEG